MLFNLPTPLLAALSLLSRAWREVVTVQFDVDVPVLKSFTPFKYGTSLPQTLTLSSV